MDPEQLAALIEMSKTDPTGAMAIAMSQIGYGFASFYNPGEPFIDVNDFTIPAVIGSTLNNQQIALNLDFDLYIYAIGLAPDTVRTAVGAFSLLLKAGGGNVLFGNAPVRSDGLWGPAVPVYTLRRPFKVAKGVNLMVDLTNQIAAENPIEIILVGWKSQSAYIPS